MNAKNYTDMKANVPVRTFHYHDNKKFILCCIVINIAATYSLFTCYLHLAQINIL